jgi:hypothetical protein
VAFDRPRPVCLALTFRAMCCSCDILKEWHGLELRLYIQLLDRPRGLVVRSLTTDHGVPGSNPCSIMEILT